jgi:hypothetical protein
MKKIYFLALLAFPLGMAAKFAYADANVTLTSAHQESYVVVSTFTGASSVSAAVSVTTTLYPHRSFAAYNSTDHDLVLTIVGPTGTLGSSSISPLYIPSGTARVIDNGSDQVVLPAGAKIYVWYPGSAPTTGSLILDQLF